MGTPSKAEWADGYRLAERRGYTFPKIKGKGIKRLITNASSDAISFMLSCLEYNPKSRPKASDLLKHEFFTNHNISKDIYQHTKSKAITKYKSNSNDIESLKISPSGISIDNSPFNIKNLQEAVGLKTGFELKKPAEKYKPMMPSYPNQFENQRNSDNLRQRQSYNMPESLMQQSVLLQKPEEIPKPVYYMPEEKKSYNGIDPDAYKSRLKDPIYPYFQQSSPNIFDTYK